MRPRNIVEKILAQKIRAMKTLFKYSVSLNGSLLLKTSSRIPNRADFFKTGGITQETIQNTAKRPKIRYALCANAKGANQKTVQQLYKPGNWAKMRQKDGSSCTLARKSISHWKAQMT